MKEMKGDLSSLKGDLTSINETISQQYETMRSLNETVKSLSEDLVEHKNQTTSELAGLQTSLQSSINTTHNEQLTQLGGKMDMLDLKLVSLNSHMSLVISSLESQVDAMNNPFNSTLASVDATSILMRDDLNCVKTDLSSLNDSIKRVFDKVEEHEDHMTAELMELNEYLKKNLTHQISSNDNLGVHTCGGTGGWRRAVYLDMTDPNTDCPSGWRETGYSKRTCGRATDGRFVCDSVTFPVSGGKYSQVCGRIKAYQWGGSYGFSQYDGYYERNTIDDVYFSGVILTHGSPRQHIWTFAIGNGENHTYVYNSCPCDTKQYIPIPPFVGEDYFCESGYIFQGYGDPSFISLHSNDTLWDGMDCISSSRCCSHHNPPYFTKTLSIPTTDNIELRVCGIAPISGENVAIELIELYVKDSYIETKLMELDQRLKESFTHQTNTINNLGVHTCGGTGGWRRAVYLDMTDPNTDCPSGWRETGYSKRTCGRVSGRASRGSVMYSTCDSVTFSVSGGEYSQMCGRIKAYQWGDARAFYWHRYGQGTIDDAYFSGVAVMHGSPRQHIWTFAAGIWNNNTRLSHDCPCNTRSVPSFVGEDYFCESGYIRPDYWDRRTLYLFDSNDILWDGRCHSSNTCCTRRNPPYFTKYLYLPTTDDIELRMCGWRPHWFEDRAVELIELYVK